MPQNYDAEVSIAGVFVCGFNGENAFCIAMAYTRDNPLQAPAVYEIYDRTTDQYWVGPRPGRP